MTGATDTELFAEMFDLHYDAVFRFAERRVGWEPAGEIASDVFATAFRLRQDFVGDASTARPWLLGIASRRVMHEHRRFARHMKALARLASDSPQDADTDAVDRRLDAASRAAALRDALVRVDADSREVLLLVAWDGLSYGEAAEALSIPIGTVRSRVHRARRALAALMGDTFLDDDNETEVVR